MDRGSFQQYSSSVDLSADLGQLALLLGILFHEIDFGCVSMFNRPAG